MRWSTLYAITLLGLSQAKQNLRGQTHARQLESASVPFGVSLQITVSDAKSGTKPTTEDYNGVVSAIETWFHDNSVAFFADNTKYALTYTGTQCQLKEEDTSYLESSPDGFQHTVSMSCEATFDTDGTTEMISSLALATEATQNFDLNTIVPKYVVPLAPTNSPFTDTRSIRVNIVASSENDNSSSPNGTVEVVLQWTMSVLPPVVDRQPTEEEYASFMANSDEWLSDIFHNYFPASQSEFAHFTGGISSSITAKSFSASAEFPHSITIHSDVEFERSNDEPFPPMMTWVMALHQTGVKTFQQDYLGSTPGLFQKLQFIQYRALM